MSEFSLISKLRNNQKKSFSPHLHLGIGDDCAILKDFADNKFQALSVDTFNEDIHFSFNYMTPKEIGLKSLRASISDLSAMGVRCSEILISISIPIGGAEFAEKILTAISDECSKKSITIIGGDTCSSKYFSITITVLGYESKENIKLRSTAQLGDDIYITAIPGLSLAGLTILSKNIQSTSKAAKLAVNKHKLPLDLQKEADILGKCKEVHAMIDVSDGLASELNHIARESGFGFELNNAQFENIEIFKELSDLTNISYNNLIFESGEEFELLYTVQKDFCPPIDSIKIACITSTTENSGQNFLRNFNGYEHRF